MKKIIITCAFAIAQLLFTSCKENVTSNVEAPRQSNLKILVPDISPSAIRDATINNEMSLNSQELSYFSLNSIISKLVPDNGLWDYIHNLFENHNQFTNDRLNYIKGIEIGIIEKANNTRLLIINNMNNGFISSVEAEKEISLLNENVRKTFKANTVYKLIVREIITNRKVVLNAIASHLNTVQLKEWNNFIAQNSYVFYGEPL